MDKVNSLEENWPDTDDFEAYKSRSGLVLGFHGTNEKIAKKVVLRKGGLRLSKNEYDWLGSGIYFWENDPKRAWEWADGHCKENERPAVVGAVLDLGYCLDLSTREACEGLSVAYNLFVEDKSNQELRIPKNSGGEDKLRRELDCAVVNFLHEMRKRRELKEYNSVRCHFQEDRAIYPGSGFRLKTHTQIAVRDSSCIKGYFLPV